MKIENLSTLKIHELSQKQFDRENNAGNLQSNELYLTPAPEIDVTPTEGSENLVTSGGVYAAIAEVISYINTLIDSINGDAV